MIPTAGVERFGTPPDCLRPINIGNVWYGDPKCTATRNNRLFARNDTTNNLLFRVAYISERRTLRYIPKSVAFLTYLVSRKEIPSGKREGAIPPFARVFTTLRFGIVGMLNASNSSRWVVGWVERPRV